MSKKTVYLTDLKVEDRVERFSHSCFCERLKIVFVSDSYKTYYFIDEVVGNPENVLKELETCTHFLPLNPLSILVGQAYDLESEEDDYIQKHYQTEKEECFGKLLHILTNKGENKIDVKQEFLDSLINNIHPSPWSNDGAEVLMTMFHLLSYSSTDSDLIISKLLEDLTIKSLAKYRILKERNSDDIHHYKHPIKYISTNEKLIKKVIYRALYLSKTKNNIGSIFDFLHYYCESERIIKLGFTDKCFKFDIIKNDEELFTLFKDRLKRLCKFISKTTSYPGIAEIMWLGDYIDWEILNLSLVKLNVNERYLDYFPELFPVSKPSPYQFYIDSFKSPYSGNVARCETFLDLCDKEEFKKIVEDIADNVMLYYSAKSPNDANYNFSNLLNKDNVILLMNNIVPLIEKSKNKKFFNEFMRMFDDQDIITHIEFGECKNVKKKFLQAKLTDK